MNSLETSEKDHESWKQDGQYYDPQRRSDLCYLLDRLDEHIHIEFDLIGHRMNVLAVSQAFLFAAYTTDLLAPDSFRELRGILLWMIPSLGILVSLLVEFTIIAAVYVIRKRKSDREVIRDRLRLDLIHSTPKAEIFDDERMRDMKILDHVSPGSLPHRLGNYLPLGLAPLIILSWALLLFHLTN